MAPSKTRLALVVSALLAVAAPCAHGAYHPVAPRAARRGEIALNAPGACDRPGEIALNAPGACDRPGATYLLTADITSPRSALFLANNVTLDLNGRTVTYAAGYAGVPNCSFGDGLRGWDVSRAPGAEATEMPMQHPMVGKAVCILPEGQELVSPYVELPVAGRAYYAMVAVASHEMQVGVFVEDEQGREVQCAYQWGGNTRPCCPEPVRACKLGGGVVFALVFGQPAGKYRVRVKAVQKTCILGAVDIRPAMDVGVGVVESTLPWAYYKCILDGDGCAFFDYTKPGAPGEPVDSIPQASGPGTVTIRNGVIRLGSPAIRTWGAQSTARDAKLVIENVKFEAAGINTHALNAPSATLHDCRAEIDAPWIIDRHRQDDYAVSLPGPAPSEVSGCELIGDQGQLAVGGAGSSVHDNLLVNRQRVVNHYSLGIGGRGIRVFRNRIIPDQGSGILLGAQQDVEIADNDIRVAASPPVNEYFNTDYSVNAIRLTDYNAPRGNPAGFCGNNHIHHNRIRVTGRVFQDADPGYKPMTYGVFMSVGGGQNDIHGNEIVVDQQSPPNDERHGAYAFYVGGSEQGGIYYRNTITSNVTPVWISNMYGPGANVLMVDNLFRSAPGAQPFVPFMLGWYEYPAKNVGFFSNRFEGTEFGVEINDYTTNYISSYEFGWTLTVHTAPAAQVVILRQDGAEVQRGQANARGVFVARLPQYRAAGTGQVLEEGKRSVRIERTDVSHYRVQSAGKEQPVTLTADTELTF